MSAEPKSVRVLGVDTSLRNTGLGVVEAAGSRLRGICYDVLHVPAGRPLSACLLQIHQGISRVIGETRPDVIAIEGVFFARYAKTALLLGHARGVVIAAAAASGVPVHEYEPRRVKQALAGYGGASKEQMQRMIMARLGLATPPPEDAADALAIAICHLHNLTRLALTAAAPL